MESWEEWVYFKTRFPTLVSFWDECYFGYEMHKARKLARALNAATLN